MGTGRGGTGPKSRSKKKFYKKHVMCVKRRTKDIDQIQEEMQQLAEGARTLGAYVDADVAGGGNFFCVECSRPFISAAVLEEHKRTKGHKKRVKIVAEEPYTQKDADRAAGLQPS
jgi:hypothetical protein